MCPTKEEEVLEKNKAIEALGGEILEKEEVSEEEVPLGSRDPEDSVEEVEFEGVSKVEDIPKGKEKSYGI